MANTSARPADELERVMQTYGNMLFRIALITLGNTSDAEDAVQDTGILEALMSLPEKLRVVLTLYYVEEYSIETIAKVIGRTTSAVKMRLQKGRKLLEEIYRKHSYRT